MARDENSHIRMDSHLSQTAPERLEERGISAWWGHLITKARKLHYNSALNITIDTDFLYCFKLSACPVYIAVNKA